VNDYFWCRNSLLYTHPNAPLIQNWEDGAIVAHTFGRPLAFNAAGAKLIVQNREHELKIINLKTGAESESFQFPGRVASAAFRSDGLQFAALTADQKNDKFATPQLVEGLPIGRFV